jgi:thiamine kinase-like enzyme
MDPRLELAGLMGRMAFHIAKERITNPRPVSLREVPPTPEHLTEEWLTLALCDGVPGARVTGHELGPRNDGTSSRRALRVSYNQAGVEAGLLEHLFTKSSPTFATRFTSAAADLSEIEAMFYSLIRPGLEIEAPATYYSAFDPISNRQLLIVDDVSVTRGAQFGTILTRTLTKEQAEQVVDTLAALHAKFWNARLGSRFGSWLPTAYDWMDRLNVTINAHKRTESGFQRGREVIPAQLYDRRGEVHEALMRSLQINVTGPQTVLHGDVHPGNWYLTGDGRMGVYDWQCMVRGGWARDIAYALSTHLTVEDRQAWENELVTRHGERLADAGIAPPRAEDAFLAYRQQMFHAMFMWLGTLGKHPMQSDLQPADITLESVRRTCQAATDLDSLGAVANGGPPSGSRTAIARVASGLAV